MTEKEFLKSYELYKEKYNKLENELDGAVKHKLSFSEYKQSYKLFSAELGGKNVLRQIITQTAQVSTRQARRLVEAYNTYSDINPEIKDVVGKLTIKDFKKKSYGSQIFLAEMQDEREEGGGGVSDYVDSPIL